ncbi:hypothetical protein MWU75_04435 [Ornithinimicrobium sp. F0845]|uniref:hypothetical protein n=1 Tax=Ornithinimicrobium sp. F0845 TaxID=2926412 RepID=UPI001FF372E0|nr:hypothetical protein [Ornithinimicrobium sp. F0845]MCK0111382.1 hypothetical protein [Ornithinimicrobium sp. F0845]
MSGNPSSLPLLGLAEELSACEVPVGDPVTEDALRAILDRVVDAVVDVSLGRSTLSRPHPPGAGVAPGSTAPTAQLDPVACSALAARCHRAAALLTEVEDQRLAGVVASCLTTIADGLQRLTQDASDARVHPPAAQQRLRRSLVRAGALLDAAAP